LQGFIDGILFFNVGGALRRADSPTNNFPFPPKNMRREWLILLTAILLIALPTAILGLLAARTLSNWNTLIDRQWRSAADELLLRVRRDLVKQLDVEVDRLEQSVAARPENEWLAAVADWRAATPWAGDIAIWDPVGERRFPPPLETVPSETTRLNPVADIETLQRIRRLELQSPTAAAAAYRELLSRAAPNPALRAEATLGWVRACRKNRQPEAALALLDELAVSLRGWPDLRDMEGYEYVLIRLKESIGLRLEMGQTERAWEELTALMTRLEVRFERIHPLQRDGLLDFLETVREQWAKDSALMARHRVLLEKQRLQISRLDRDPIVRAGWEVLEKVEPGNWRVSQTPTGPLWLRRGETRLQVAIRPIPREFERHLEQQLSGFRSERLIPEVVAVPGFPDIRLPAGDEARRLAQGEGMPPLTGLIFGVRWMEGSPHPQEGGLSNKATVFSLALLLSSILAGGWLAWSLGMRWIRREAARAELLAGVSHDLRTPLAAIRMLAETLALGTVRESEKRDRFLATILKECDRLGELTERALFFMRCGQEALRIHRTECDVGALLQETVETFRRYHPEESVEIQLTVDPAAGPVWADPNALRQLFFNLCDNAFKFSPDRKRIEVQVATAPRGRMEISIRDYGIGIGGGERRRIFSRFERGGDPRVGRVAGSGLGLALCREIVRAHGGRIWVETPEGGGSRFVVEMMGMRRA
jgi:signal transduction histidine kinase